MADQDRFPNFVSTLHFFPCNYNTFRSYLVGLLGPAAGAGEDAGAPSVAAAPLPPSLAFPAPPAAADAVAAAPSGHGTLCLPSSSFLHPSPPPGPGGICIMPTTVGSAAAWWHFLAEEEGGGGMMVTLSSCGERRIPL